MKLSIIVPAHNERKCIKVTLFKLKEVLKNDFEVIVVDDHSSDGTGEIVRKLLKDFPNLKLIANTNKRGFANSLRAGFKAASGDVVIPVMGDFCDEITLIPKLYAKIREGWDIVCASRYIKGGKRIGGLFIKHWGSYCLSFFLHKFTKIPTTDAVNAFKAYRKIVLDDINTVSEAFEISAEIVIKAHKRGYKITELPTIWQDRRIGKSNFRIFRNGIKYLKCIKLALLS